MTKQLQTLAIGVFLLLGFTSIHAQGIYFNAKAGYNFGLAGQDPYDYYYDYESFRNDNTGERRTDSKRKKGFSMGKGINIDLGAGYNFNKHIAVELNASYLFAGKVATNEKYSRITGANTEVDTYVYTWSSNMLRLIPAIKLSAGFETINPYAKLGLLMGFGSMKLTEEVNYNSVAYAGTSNYTTKYQGGVAIGLSSALGVSYQVSDQLALVLELNLVSMSHAPNKSKYIQYEEDGIDLLPTLTTNEKETIYKNETTYSTTAVINESQPNEELKIKLPFSSYGIHFGIQFQL